MKKPLWSGLAMAGALAFAAVGAPATAAGRDDLKVISIDVEGGAATLYITPQGHSILIDTGWVAGAGGPRPTPGAPPPPPTPSSAQRIVAAMKGAGLTKLDYLVISHYHPDHLGGAVELMGLMPIGAFVDHGDYFNSAPDASPVPPPPAMFTAYQKALEGKKRIVLKAGESLKMDGLTAVAVDSDKQVTKTPLTKAPSPTGTCAGLPSRTDVGGDENPRSVGLVFKWGKSRVMALGDTTWDVENALVCPVNLIGPIDLMMIDNHGTENANSPALLEAVKPVVVVFNNGLTKGADGAVLDRVKAGATPPAIWQLHVATRSPDKNAPVAQIANSVGPDEIYSLIATVDKKGGVTVLNPRNGFEKTYHRAAP
jgi:competence protein ComEC